MHCVGQIIYKFKSSGLGIQAVQSIICLIQVEFRLIRGEITFRIIRVYSGFDLKLNKNRLAFVSCLKKKTVNYTDQHHEHHFSSPMCSIHQRGARPSCWPAVSSTTPLCSLDWTPGPWREQTRWSSPRPWSRDPRTATAKQRTSENSSYSNTSAKALTGLGVCWCLADLDSGQIKNKLQRDVKEMKAKSRLEPEQIKSILYT